MPYSVRDLLGHFVKPCSMKGKMCPHACCRNKRVHPVNMPVILPSKVLRRASDEDLAAHFDRVQGDSRKDERARAQVLHEMERRDAAAGGQEDPGAREVLPATRAGRRGARPRASSMSRSRARLQGCAARPVPTRRRFPGGSR